MLDLIRTFVDAGDAQVAVPTFNGHLTGVAHAAVYLHDAVNDAVGHVRAVEFRHTRLVTVILMLISFPRSVECKPLGGLNLNGGICDHPLNGLAVGDGLPKGDALL